MQPCIAILNDQPFNGTAVVIRIWLGCDDMWWCLPQLSNTNRLAVLLENAGMQEPQKFISHLFYQWLGPTLQGITWVVLDPTSCNLTNSSRQLFPAMAQGDDFKLQSLWPLSRSHDWSCCLAWVLDENFPVGHGAHQAISSWLHASFFLIWPFTPVWEVSSSVFREISRVSSCSRKQVYLWRVLTSL